MGQPPILKPYLSFVAGSNATAAKFDSLGSREFISYIEGGIFKDIGSPVASVLGLAAEFYVGGRSGVGDVIDGGMRALAVSPFLNLSIGGDVNFRDSRLDLLFRFKVPIRRSGFLVRGGEFQVNWLPWRGHSWHVGLSLPLGQPWRGKTRPRNAHQPIDSTDPPVLLYTPDVPELEEAVAILTESAHWINRLASPFIDQGHIDRGKAYENFERYIDELDSHLASTGPRFPNGRSFEEETRVYHEELDRAFSIAASGRPFGPGESDEIGRRVANDIREMLLEFIVYPYNRLLGQRKIDNTITEFAMAGYEDFQNWLLNESGVPSHRVDAVRWVARQLIDVLDASHDFTVSEWNDRRLGWIPLQLALRPEEYDSQDELNRLVAEAVGEDWTEGNRVWYIQNAQFQWELAESIRRAEDYHVLWIHDIAPFDAGGDPDEVTYVQMVDYYLGSLIEKVRQYDETAKLPLYMILFDQHYYEVKRSRLWMNVLENPMEKSFPFPDDPEYAYMKLGLAKAQQELREAVASSRLLQERVAEFGEEWLNNRIKVHVNVTNPADPNYWNNQLLPLLGYPDNIMRDHRKIAFYDVTEEDPYKGMAIYSGMGIGEHYVGPTWEDRAIMVQGPAILNVKQEARELLLSQGFAEEEIPPPLRQKPKSADYDERVSAEAAALTVAGEPIQRRGMELHNRTGYLAKPINVAKAVLYSLMPPGSVIILPDSLWNSSFFAALLVGNCLRGAKVFIIAPSLENAPGGEGFPQMSRAQELYARLIKIQEILGDHIEAAGGMLKTGLYDVDIDVSNVPAQMEAIVEGARAYPWLAELFAFHPDTWDLLDDIEDVVGDFELEYTVEDATQRKPQLHLKANYFATESAWSDLLALPEFADLTREYAREQATLELDRDRYSDIRDLYDNVRGAATRVVEAYVATVPRERLDRAAAFFMVGSANQDYRSMYMDGEVAYTTAGLQSLQGLFDFLYLMGSATWVDTFEELEALLPEQSGFKWQIGRLIKEAL